MPDRGGKAVFKVQIIEVVVKLNGTGCGCEVWRKSVPVWVGYTMVTDVIGRGGERGLGSDLRARWPVCGGVRDGGWPYWPKRSQKE